MNTRGRPHAWHRQLPKPVLISYRFIHRNLYRDSAIHPIQPICRTLASACLTSAFFSSNLINPIITAVSSIYQREIDTHHEHKAPYAYHLFN